MFQPLSNLQKYDIILASQSPRRQELLSGLSINFTVHTIDNIDESYPHNLHGEDIPIYIAKQKTEAYKKLLKENTLLITADTIVYHQENVFGKPKSKEDAKQMLAQLSGKEHFVITAVSICTVTTQIQFAVTTKVRFSELSTDEIEYYVNSYSPMDKAGSYGVQEWIGYAAVEEIHGSFYNVMGLPIHRLYQELKKF